MNPEHSLKSRKKVTIPIQGILRLTTPKNIARNRHPEIERRFLRQRILHEQSSQRFLPMLDRIIHLITGVSILGKAPLRCRPGQYQFFRTPPLIQTKEPSADKY